MGKKLELIGNAICLSGAIMFLLYNFSAVFLPKSYTIKEFYNDTNEGHIMLPIALLSFGVGFFIYSIGLFLNGKLFNKDNYKPKPPSKTFIIILMFFLPIMFVPYFWALTELWAEEDFAFEFITRLKIDLFLFSFVSFIIFSHYAYKAIKFLLVKKLRFAK